MSRHCQEVWKTKLCIIASILMGLCIRKCELCPINQFVSDIIKAVPAAGACHLQLLSGDKKADFSNHCRMIPRINLSNATIGRSRRSCSIVILNLGPVELLDYINWALKKNRVRLDYYIILIQNYSEVDGLPDELRSFSNVLPVAFSSDLAKAIIYGEGAFTYQRDYRHPIVAWTRNDGFSQYTHKLFPSWRTGHINMHNESMILSYLKNPEFSFVSSLGTVEGRDVYMVQSLAVHRGFHLRYLGSFPFTGTYNASTGQWNGFLGALSRKEADIAVGGFTPNPTRLPAIDYLTVPMQLSSASLTFVTSPPQPDSQFGGRWYGFLFPLDWNTWLVLLAICLLFFLVAKTVFGIKLNHASFNIVLYIVNSLTEMGNSKLFPTRPSQYVLLLTWSLPVMVIYLGYSSSLMANMIIAPQPKLIDSWEELIQSDYTIIIQKDSAYPSYFREATKDTNPKYAAVWQKMLSQDQTVTFQVLTPSQLQQKLVNNPRLAAVDSTLDKQLLYNSNGDQVVHISKERDYCLYDAFMIRKNYPYYDPLYSDLSWLRDTGLPFKFDDIAHMAYGDYTKIKKIQSQSGTQDSSNGDKAPLKFSNLEGAFYLLIAGSIIALIEFATMEYLPRITNVGTRKFLLGSRHIRESNGIILVRSN